MADRASLRDRFARSFGDAIASIRTALIDRGWFGYEELSRSNDTNFYGAPDLDRSIEQGAPPERIEKEWLYPGRAEFSQPASRKPHDLAREFGAQREHQLGRDDPSLGIDR